jgi:hypothetical protein
MKHGYNRGGLYGMGVNQPEFIREGEKNE